MTRMVNYMIRALLLAFLMWTTRNHYMDDYEILIDDYEKAKRLGLLNKKEL